MDTSPLPLLLGAGSDFRCRRHNRAAPVEIVDGVVFGRRGGRLRDRAGVDLTLSHSLSIADSTAEIIL